MKNILFEILNDHFLARLGFINHQDISFTKAMVMIFNFWIGNRLYLQSACYIKDLTLVKS